MACLAVQQIHVDRVLKDLDSTDLDGSERGFVKLVSVETEEGYTNVGVSTIFPRVYPLLESPRWILVDVEPEDVYCNQHIWHGESAVALTKELNHSYSLLCPSIERSKSY